MTPRLRILHLEDSEADAELAAARLAADGLACDIVRVDNRADLLAALDGGGFDLVLADYSLPAFDGLTALRLVRERAPELPVILLSGTLGEDTAVEALKNGATDYLLKDRIVRLGSALRRALEEGETRRERRRAEEALRRSEAMYRSLFENIPDGVFLWNTEGRARAANPALVTMLGFAGEGELLAAETASLFVRREDMEELRALLAEHGRVRDFETVLRRVDGAEVAVRIAVRASRQGGEVIGYEGTITDVTEQKRYQEQLLYLASHDSLTGLYNRRRFTEELERQVANARRSRVGGAVLWFDVDRFKDVNDSLGHRVGDQVLVQFAGALRRCLRGTDVLARLGGDEFAALLPGISREDALALAERVQRSLRAEKVALDGTEVRITASIGLAFFPEPCDSAQELLTQADLALYHAKEEGRDTVRVYQPGVEWQAELQSRVGWARRLREALEADDAFVFHAQPILDLESRAVERYELLLRIRDEDGSTILPGDFLPAAERFGLIREIDHLVAVRAIRLLAELQEAGRRATLQVNLSAQSLADPTLLDRISRELHAAGADPSLLVWEVTESAAIADLHRASELVRRLRELGCQIALDDFGMGFSSFAHLKHLPVDYLKIDGSFVRGLTQDPVDRHLVQAIAQLARGLRKQTIGEYVEDAATLELLAGLGVHHAQGYHVGRPMPVERLLADAVGEAAPASR